jgi:hypothetical protein
MRFVMRFWKCRKCGQVNKTIALDDTVKCDFCAQALTIQLLGVPARKLTARIVRGTATMAQATARAMITSA